ncbi:AbrB family transcriptional regulator, partial [Bifidobacteriaceae bacterium NR015]
LASLGVSAEENAPVVLASMVRRAVALNPGVPQNVLQELCNDKSEDVSLAARSRC